MHNNLLRFKGRHRLRCLPVKQKELVSVYLNDRRGIKRSVFKAYLVPFTCWTNSTSNTWKPGGWSPGLTDGKVKSRYLPPGTCLRFRGLHFVTVVLSTATCRRQLKMRGARRRRHHVVDTTNASKEAVRLTHRLAQVWLVVDRRGHSSGASFAGLVEVWSPLKEPLRRRSRCAATRGFLAVFMIDPRSSCLCCQTTDHLGVAAAFCIQGSAPNSSAVWKSFYQLARLNCHVFPVLFSIARAVAILIPETPLLSRRDHKTITWFKEGDITDCSFNGKDACLSGHKMFF